MKKLTWSRGLIVSATVALLVLLTGFSLQGASNSAGNNNASSTSSPSATPSASPTVPPDNKCKTWVTAPSDYTNNRWFASGIAEIKNATTPEEATNAAHVWLAEVRKDPNLLAGAAKYFLDQDVAKATLSSDNCATDAAVQLVTQVELTIGQAKSIVPENAPASGFNSGVDNGVVVGATNAGINGDRKAIKITLSDGREIWIMSRCGNIVTIGLPPVPSGPTDQPPVPAPAPTPTPCPPGEVVNVNGTCVVPKSSDPTHYRQPGDSGKGADVGTGTKPAATVSTPAEAAPPTVVTSVPGGGGVVDTPTKAPASETGVVAPGADPAPATASPAPISVGGSNNGGVSGP